MPRSWFRLVNYKHVIAQAVTFVREKTVGMKEVNEAVVLNIVNEKKDCLTNTMLKANFTSDDISYFFKNKENYVTITTAVNALNSTKTLY